VTIPRVLQVRGGGQIYRFGNLSVSFTARYLRARPEEQKSGRKLYRVYCEMNLDDASHSRLKSPTKLPFPLLPPLPLYLSISLSVPDFFHGLAQVRKRFQDLSAGEVRALASLSSELDFLLRAHRPLVPVPSLYAHCHGPHCASYERVRGRTGSSNELPGRKLPHGAAGKPTRR